MTQDTAHLRMNETPGKQVLLDAMGIIWEMSCVSPEQKYVEFYPGRGILSF